MRLVPRTERLMISRLPVMGLNPFETRISHTPGYIGRLAPAMWDAGHRGVECFVGHSPTLARLRCGPDPVISSLLVGRPGLEPGTLGLKEHLG